MGDFTADGLRAGYFGAYRASTGEGVHREFDPKATPGLDTWAYGFHPPTGVVPMGSGAPSNGYFEMWGGNVRTFPDERASLAGGAAAKWTERIRPFSSRRAAAPTKYFGWYDVSITQLLVTHSSTNIFQAGSQGAGGQRASAYALAIRRPSAVEHAEQRSSAPPSCSAQPRHEPT